MCVFYRTAIDIYQQETYHYIK